MKYFIALDKNFVFVKMKEMRTCIRNAGWQRRIKVTIIIKIKLGGSLSAVIFVKGAQKAGKWSWNAEGVITTKEDQNMQEEFGDCNN